MSEDETKDTQPLLKDILEEMRSGFAEMRQFRIETKDELTRINKKIDRLSAQVLHIAVEGEMLGDRVTKIEGSSGVQ